MKKQCEKCGKKFKEAQGLEHHIKAKHGTLIEKSKLPVKQIAYFVFSILVIGVLFFSFRPNLENYEPLLEDGEHFKGSPNATVEIIKYSDFQCPACKQATGTVDQIMEEYGDRVKFTYRHFPLTNIHEFAFKASEASECAADQGKFWEYHDILFARQQALNVNNLKKYAEEIGLNQTLFDACLDSGSMIPRVNADFNEGRKTVRSTPTFFVNGKRIEGVQPFHMFKNLIESGL